MIFCRLLGLGLVVFVSGCAPARQGDISSPEKADIRSLDGLWANDCHPCHSPAGPNSYCFGLVLFAQDKFGQVSLGTADKASCEASRQKEISSLTAQPKLFPYKILGPSNKVRDAFDFNYKVEFKFDGTGDVFSLIAVRGSRLHFGEIRFPGEEDGQSESNRPVHLEELGYIRVKK